MSGEAQWTDDDLQFMRAALQQVGRRRAAATGGERRQAAARVANRALCPMTQACRALDEGETPVGCVVVRDGAIAATGCNRTNATRNVRRDAACWCSPAWIR